MIYNNEERIGVYSIAKIFVEDFQWIFREQPINDFGIDGFVEIAKTGSNLKDKIPTGKLIAVQIKSGKSFLKENTDKHFIFRGSKRHVEYWLNYSIPVILLLYDKESNSAYWEEINHSTVTLTNQFAKIKVPRKNQLNKKNKESLINISHFRNRYEYKVWQLRTSIEEVALLVRQKLFLYVEIDDIPNSDYYNISLLITDENSDNCPEIIHRYWDENPSRFYYSFCLPKDSSFKEGLTDILPWGNLYYNEQKFSDGIFIDEVVKDIVSFGIQESSYEVLKLKRQKKYLALACFLAGNYSFKLELKANSLAYNFLTLNEFFNKEPIFKERIFI